MMEPLRLKPRQPVEDDIENWDDEDFDVDGDELNLRSSTNNSSVAPRRRDSTSSHISFRSDLESWHGEEQQVHLPSDDERSTMAAIAAAENAGIPLPKNVPSSALTGGTIKRLGGRKIRRIIQEDWESDLELPDASQGLQMKLQNHTEFPETIRQVSGGSIQGSPIKPGKSIGQDGRRNSIMSTVSALSAGLSSLDRFRDTDDDDDFFGDNGDTIKVPKTRQPLPLRPVPFITPPTPQKPEDKLTKPDDDFEQDLELPSHGKLQLSMRRDIPKSSISQPEDVDWGEGSSLGTRYGGTRRDGHRSSSASALSPSLSSTFTVESEDDTFDGLLLPPGRFDFQEKLNLRKTSPQPDDFEDDSVGVESPTKKRHLPAEADRQDFLDGLEIGDGDVFKPGKLTLHRNIKIRDNGPTSPIRPKTAVSLTFTNKPMPPQTRIPRLNHERSHSTALEPVSESGGPIPQRVRRPQSRLGGHSAQSSVTSLPAASTTSSSGYSVAPAPRRAEMAPRTSFMSMRNELSTTNAQLLRQKRSLPAVRALNAPSKQYAPRSDRPPSRSDNNRPTSGVRPKTPIERHRSATESPTSTRKNSVPFLPAGSTNSQSQHRTTKPVRGLRRHDSDNSLEPRPNSRSYSRNGIRSPSPRRYKVASDTWERLSKPKNKKQFGDGHELDGFDDLPTSKESESRFLKQPTAGAPKATTLRRVQSNIQPDRTVTPSPWSPQTALKAHNTPSFARDTAASRIARETSLAHRAPSGGPLASITAQRTAQMSPRAHQPQQPHLPQKTVRSKKSTKRPQQLKPHLISNKGDKDKTKVVNGMVYNPSTLVWEGNENALNAFDAAAISTPSTKSVPPHANKDKETTTPRPALITNFSATNGVQVVGGMVFDPHNMCWLKLGPQSVAESEATDSLDGFNGFDDDEDVFKDIPDLEDNTVDDDRDGRTSDVKDDWLVGEEFDVGPEFVRRQREEEERWRRKCEKWVSRGPRSLDTWRWTIRALVSQLDEVPMHEIDKLS